MSLIDGRLRTADVVALVADAADRDLPGGLPEPVRAVARVLRPDPHGGRRSVATGERQLAERAEVGSGPPSPGTTSARLRSIARPAATGPVRTRGGGTDGTSMTKPCEWLAGSLQWERTLARLRSGASDEVVAVLREQLTEPIGPKGAGRSARQLAAAGSGARRPGRVRDRGHEPAPSCVAATARWTGTRETELVPIAFGLKLMRGERARRGRAGSR